MACRVKPPRLRHAARGRRARGRTPAVPGQSVDHLCYERRMTTKAASNEIEIIRVYDAPLEAVWNAWVDPAQVGEWWGPRGFTISTKQKEVRTGGTWTYTMHGPDGKDYPNKTLFLEVDERARLVYDHGATDDTPPLFRVTALFSETGGQTTLHMRMALATPEAAAETAKFIKAVGGNGTWDRLGEYLQKRLHDRDCFLINRSFDVPVETMYAMWTEPQKLCEWLAPTGSTMEFLRADLVPGKASFYRMGNGDITMYGRTHYLEFQSPHRLVYTQQFCDEHEAISRHPLAPTWPETMHTTVTFAPESPGRTRVTVQWIPYGAATAEEVATFMNARAGMTLGWTGSFDKLDALLAAD